MGKRSASNIDLAIGRKIRKLRNENGLTMQEFAGRIGITQQQAHKYEKGLNRISAGRLARIAEVLNIPVSYFFDEASSSAVENLQRQRQHTELVKYFQAIPSLRHQDAISILIRVLAET